MPAIPRLPRWLWLLATVACGPPPPVDVAASDPRIEWVGPTQVLENGAVRFAWPATQLRLRFQGTGLRASIADQARQDEEPELDWLAIEIDGVAREKLGLRAGQRAYTLAEGLADGPHTLVLTKRTEPAVGTITLHGFYEAPEAKLLPAPVRRARRIEVVGDSICAGYGIENTKPGCSYDPAEQDASRTFVALTARSLNAELIVQAWSGRGLYRNYLPEEREPMPTLYGRVLPDDPSSPRVGNKFDPDVVILGLGTNDFIAGHPDPQRFLTAYRGLVGRVRTASPRAKLVLILSPMLTEDYPSRGARSAARALLGELRDQLAAAGADVTLLEQAWAANEPWGCGGHPSLRTHARFAKELTALLRQKLGW